MPEEPSGAYIEGDALSVGEVILRLQGYASRILRSWIWIAIAVGLGLALGYYKYSKEKTTYLSEVKFIINESNGGGGLAQVNGLLSSFGLGGGSSGSMNPNTVISLLESNMSARKILGLSEGFPEHDENLFIQIENTEEVQLILDRLNADGLTPSQLSKEKEIIEFVVGTDSKDGILTGVWDDEDKTITIKVKSTDEDLSYKLSQIAYTYLEDFYNRDALIPQEKTFKLLKSKSDSLRGRVSYFTGQLAKFEDSQQGLLLKSQAVKKQEYSRELSVATIAYAKSLENQAISEFSLSTNQPKFKKIDQSNLPLTRDKPKLLKSLLMYGILAGFFALVIILIRILYKETTHSAKLSLKQTL